LIEKLEIEVRKLEIVGLKIQLMKMYSGRGNEKRGSDQGEYIIEKVDKKDVRLRRIGVGYKECISPVDLRLKHYVLKLENGKHIKFKPMVDYKKFIDSGGVVEMKGQKLINKERLIELCKEHGTGTAVAKIAAVEFGCTEVAIKNAIYRWRIITILKKEDVKAARKVADTLIEKYSDMGPIYSEPEEVASTTSKSASAWYKDKLKNGAVDESGLVPVVYSSKRIERIEYRITSNGYIDIPSFTLAENEMDDFILDLQELKKYVG